jgi:thioredoxin reductase
MDPAQPQSCRLSRRHCGRRALRTYQAPGQNLSVADPPRLRQQHSRERDGSFRVVIGTDAARTRTVLLATGVVDKIPSIPEARSAVKRGLLRLCPICDGYEVIDQKLAVVGHSGSAVREALFMSTYSQDLTLLTLGQPLPDEQRDQLRQANIRVESRKLVTLASDGGKVHARLGDGTDQSFDAVYSALGCRPRSDLGRRLGCRLASDGRLVVTEHQETSQPNVWAAGDVVLGLNQIGVAIGEAAIAATRDPQRARPTRLSAANDKEFFQRTEVPVSAQALRGEHGVAAFCAPV